MSIEQIKKGHGYCEAAEIFDVDHTIIKQWVVRVAKEGLDGLKLKEGRGRKPKLPKDQTSKFKAAIVELQKNRSDGQRNKAKSHSAAPVRVFVYFWSSLSCN